jgi:hypothetical protein
MRIVIQCASSKEPQAGHFKAPDGRAVDFVAHPELVQPRGRSLLARPDDPVPGSPGTWRDLVAAYDASPGSNPFGLYPAYRLYSNPCYAILVERFGAENVLILSAGWGLIRSDFLTPHYDITFSNAADPSRRRRPRDHYEDFCHLPENANGPLVFFGGKDYLPLFWHLTRAMRSERVVFYNSGTQPNVPGCSLIRYDTTMRTNCHYTCASDFAAGRIGIP